MKAFFIFRDGELFGSPIGYTTEKGAQKSLVGSEDWIKMIRPYEHHIEGKNNISEEQKNLGFWKWSEVCNSWLFQREKWSRKIWQSYLKEHYQIIEKEFEIIFKD